LNEDRIDASIRGVNAKIGFLAEPISGIRFGLNYTTKTRLEIDEKYSTLIQTEFYTQDADGFNSYEDVYEGDISYTVTKPSVISAGVGMGVLSILDVDLTMERMNYSSIEMGGLGTINNRDENGAIRNDFQDVTNFKAGFTINLFDTFKPRLGYSVNPSPRRSFDAEIRYLSAGASFEVSDNISLDVGVQVARFDDNLDVYDYGTGIASVGQKVEKVQGMIGLSFRF
jgi:long-subunit fatty acid transport protein